MKLSKFFIVSSLLLGGLTPMALALRNQGGLESVRATSEKELDSVITSATASFSYDYIGQMKIKFALSEKLFISSQSFFNDHLNDKSFVDKNGNQANISEGILINDKTFKYWVELNDGPLTFPRTDGLLQFPMKNGGVFSPVAIYLPNGASDNYLEFRFNLSYFQMDSIKITFKAGTFEAYNSTLDTAYVVSEDLTYRTTLVETTGDHVETPVKVTKAPNEVIIKSTVSTTVKTEQNSNGFDYKRYTLNTNIPLDKTQITAGAPYDHYRYFFDNFVVNGKTLTYYNNWARGNSKDYTDLSDATTWVHEYETMHVDGSKHYTKYNLGTYLTISATNDYYIATICIPDQMITDLSLGTLTIGIREGSTWYTLDEKGQPIIGRVDTQAFNSKILSANNELENYVELSDYSPEIQAEIIAVISDAEAEILTAFTTARIDEIVTSAKEEIDALVDEEQIHVNQVVALIDAIPDTITYTEECGNAIRVAMEAYATLSASELAIFPAEKETKLFNAYNAFSALDLAYFKQVSKAEIQSSFNLNDYRELQQSAIQDLLAIANAAIDAATSKELVQQAVNAFYTALAALPTDVQLKAAELADAKASAKTELDAIDLSVYAPTERAQVEELIANGKVAIDQCNSIEEVTLLLNKIKAAIASIPTSEQAALAARKIQQRNIVIISVAIGSLILFVGVIFSISFLRRRRLSR